MEAEFNEKLKVWRNDQTNNFILSSAEYEDLWKKVTSLNGDDISRKMVEFFVSICEACQQKKCQKKKMVVKPVRRGCTGNSFTLTTTTMHQISVN